MKRRKNVLFMNLSCCDKLCEELEYYTQLSKLNICLTILNLLQELKNLEFRLLCSISPIGFQHQRSEDRRSINAYQNINILISEYKFTMTLDKAAFNFLIYSSKLTNTKKIAKHIYKMNTLCPAVQAMEYLSKLMSSFFLLIQSEFDFSSDLDWLFRPKTTS